jgi:hypothetical protein
LKDELRKQWLILAKSPEVMANVNNVVGFVLKYQKAIENSGPLIELKEKVKTKKQRNILNLAIFLWIYEGLYSSILDLFCLILVINDHDIFVPFNREFAKSFNDIAEIEMSMKFKFLKKHKFDALIRERDKKVRNKIAHHNFSMDTHDNVVINGEIIEIDKRLNDLFAFVIEVNAIVGECFRKTPPLEASAPS